MEFDRVTVQSTNTTPPHIEQAPTQGHTRVRLFKGLLGFFVLLGLVTISSISTTGCSDTIQPTGEPKLILTAFRQQGFGTGQVPLLIVAQVSGSPRTRCVFFEMQYANANSIRLFYFSGKEVAQDFSDFTTEKHKRCQQFNTSCLFGEISSKNSEFVLQADLTGKTGGLLVAELYDRDCRRQTDRIALQTLAIGNSLFRDERARSGEATTADGGTNSGNE